MLGRMCTAHSTACVERMFSMVDSVKSKRRNRMVTNTLDDIMRIRSYLYNRDMCCKDLIITPTMLSMHNTSMYQRSESGPQQAQPEVDDSCFEDIIDKMPIMPHHM